MSNKKKVAQAAPVKPVAPAELPAENQPETVSQEQAVPPVGQAPEVKAQQNDQTAREPGKENATIEQIEGRNDAAALLPEQQDPIKAEGLVEPGNPESEPRHMAITDSGTSPAEREAERIQAEQAGNVRKAFIAETRSERLDSFQPRRAEDVRVLVESNDHPDRSGDNLIESGANKIVISDGADEARMIDVQPQGEVDGEFDLGNGIRQTNLK